MTKTFFNFLKPLLIMIGFFVITPHSASAATYTVLTSIGTVDGVTFCGGSACTSADTIIIAAGARGGLLFQNFNGNGSYITIKNELKSPSTPVTIQNDGIISINACKYIDLRGDNDPALVTTTKSKGIVVNHASGGDMPASIWIHGISDHIKVGYIEAHAVGNVSSVSIGVIMQDANLTVANAFSDIELHHLWLHNLTAQGMYLGANDPYGKDPEYGGATYPTLRRISIHDNILEDIGNEGIDLKGCDQGPNEVYNNRIIRTGTQCVIGGLSPENLNDGDFTCGLKIPWTTHGAVVNVHDNYFESTGGPSVYVCGAYTHSYLTAIDGNVGGRIYVYNNIITNAGTMGGPIPKMGGITLPEFQTGILSRYNNFHCDAYDNIIIQPNKYGLAAGGDYDVMTAKRNLVGNSGTNYVAFIAPFGVYTPGAGADANVYHANVADFGFTAWSDDNNYANDIFTFGGDTTPPAAPTGLKVE